MTSKFFLAYVTFFPSPQQEAFFPRIFLGKLGLIKIGFI